MNDSRIGETYWIFKNSWGSSWGSDGGYLYAISDINQLVNSVIPLSPITSPNYTNADIICEDRDGDSYYFWGIGTKPATCSSCAREEPDGDNSNPNLGPMDEYGNCMVISTPNYGANTVISRNQTWTTNRVLTGDLIINSGASLTIKSKVSTYWQRNITVLSGGTLILDGGTIESGCITAESGSNFNIINDGKIYLKEQASFNIDSGANFYMDSGLIE